MLGFGFGPSNVAVWRMQGALEVGDHAEAASIAETVNADALTVRARQAVYWREYGRALARLPKQRDNAVTMLRRAEQISPEHVHRHPFTRSTLTELVAKAKRDAVGRELRGMAYRWPAPIIRWSVCHAGKLSSAVEAKVPACPNPWGALLGWALIFIPLFTAWWIASRPTKPGR